MPKIPRLQPDPRWLNMRTGGISRMPRGLAKDRNIIRDPQEELYGPELPYDLAYARDEGRIYDYEYLWAKERARQAYIRERMAQAVEMRKRELWREYMEAEDPPPGIGWPTGEAERLDDEFEAQANWDVRGMRNPNEYPDQPDWDFREHYKNAPWRMW